MGGGRGGKIPRFINGYTRRRTASDAQRSRAAKGQTKHSANGMRVLIPLSSPVHVTDEWHRVVHSRTITLRRQAAEKHVGTSGKTG